MTPSNDRHAPNIYMGAPAGLTTLPNGAVTNAQAQEALEKTTYRKPIADRVAPGVTVFGGGFLNLTLIEGDDGLIVFDTGEVHEDGIALLAKIRAISDKPIVALLYSHSHYAQGSQALVGDGRGVKIIGHPRVNANVASGGAGSLYAETAPLQISRTLQQFNHYTPEQGPDAPAGAELSFGRSGYLPVNTPVADGQSLTLAGVEMRFYTRFGSDTDDCMTVHLPGRGVVLNNLLWPFLPNIYTLRASKFRDPREWRDGLRVIRSLAPEVLVGTHARTIIGKVAIRETLDQVIDGLSAILDQTLRGILRGLGPDELRSFVRLPAPLAACPFLAETYGEVSHYGPYLFNAALGWFDGDAASINPLPPTEQAERLVAAMGGQTRVLELAQAAFKKGELAWAAQLVGYLWRIAPTATGVRALKADVLQALGRITPGQTIRSWYLSQARALRGEVHIPRIIFANTRVLALAPPAKTMDQFRVRIDPVRAGDLDMVVCLEITDRQARHAWHLRRGVVEFLSDPHAAPRKADAVLATDYDSWLRFFACKRTGADFIAGATVTTGTAADIARFFAAFDFYEAADNDILVPSAR